MGDQQRQVFDLDVKQLHRFAGTGQDPPVHRNRRAGPGDIGKFAADNHKFIAFRRGLARGVGQAIQLVKIVQDRADQHITENRFVGFAFVRCCGAPVGAG